MWVSVCKHLVGTAWDLKGTEHEGNMKGTVARGRYLILQCYSGEDGGDCQQTLINC